MSKAKELRTHPENNINMYELLSLFSPEKKSKYVDVLIRLMKKSKNFKEHVKEVKDSLSNEFPFIDKEDIDNLPDLASVYFYQFINNMFNTSDLKSFRKFCEYNERGLIKQNDVSKYDSFEEVFNALSLAEMIAQTKEMEKQIKIVHDTDEWLVLRPLTFESSKKYGSNTKWCTTQENNPDYFNKYAKKGVLIYTINKKSGYKVASFKSLDKAEPEYSWWNQKDARIDSYESELTNELRDIIWKESSENPKTNQFLYTEVEGGKSTPSKSNRRTSRIANAIERVSNEEMQDIPIQEQGPIDRMSLVSNETEYPVMEQERSEEASYENRTVMETRTPRSGAMWESETRTEIRTGTN